MELEDTKIFTGIPEMDTYILDQLDIITLYKVCQVNQYAYELCLNDIKLKNRIKAYFLRDRGGLRVGTLEADILMSEPAPAPGDIRRFRRF